MFFAKKSTTAREMGEQVVEYPFSKIWCCSKYKHLKPNQFLRLVMLYFEQLVFRKA